MICTACGEECRGVTVEFGIGFGEYWGAPFYDVQLADVSDCCEAEASDWDINLVEPDEYITETDIVGSYA